MFESQFKKLERTVTKAYFEDAMIPERELKEVTYVNNINFYKGLNTLSFLRDIGRHFRVN